jgi:hypothetical protein
MTKRLAFLLSLKRQNENQKIRMCSNLILVGRKIKKGWDISESYSFFKAGV